MITAEIIADSLSPQGDRLTTFVVIFPRIILAEFNTHRMFSRNSASSRAIPFKKMVETVEKNPFIPIAWQKAHKGMQGTEYFTFQEDIRDNEQTWLAARDRAIELATKLHSQGVTKQLCNRLLEPFMWHKVIVTSGEQDLENFFKLRCPQYQDVEGNIFRSKKDYIKKWEHIRAYPSSNLQWLSINKSQAEIHIQALAEVMWDAYNQSTPNQLKACEWHIPFGDNIDEKRIEDYIITTYDRGELWGPKDILKYRLQIATARCARVSYQTLGDNPEINYEKDLNLYERLKSSEHWSPFEHVARAMDDDEYEHYVKAVSGDIHEAGWCRNFKGFIQHRELVDL